MHIGALLSGNYYININLQDKNGTALATRSLFFQRLNAHPEKPEVAPVSLKEVMKDTSMEKVTFLDLEKTFLAKYNVQQLRSILKMLLPVSDGMQTNTINNFLKKTDEMYMRYFIYNYFQDLNAKDPGKAWKEYSDKVVEVNKKFSANGNAGYETHRGFIYLRYGKPTDIITVTSEAGSLPYEIWQYNVLTQFGNKKKLANALFQFYKQSRNLSDYFLLHSTVTGETMNSAWRTYLFSANGASSAGFSMNSRAEQYFSNR
jgi:GWxTD domain-containing protein